MSAIAVYATLKQQLEALRAAGEYKEPIELEGPQGVHVRVGGREVLNLSSNNYLGLANDPRVVEAAQRGLSLFGNGTASVRFICGTMRCHRELEERIAAFIGCEAALTYISCWDANIGLIPTLAGTPEDSIFSDALNHASIIDAIRLSKANRYIYRHQDMDDLASKLQAAPAGGVRLIVTDGVFSMEGDIAQLPRLKELAEAYGALLVIDESHATGVLGERGRGTAEHFGVLGEGAIQTSTLGKTLGGACGGYVAGPRVVCDYLLQKSRPHLFSNALPPSVCYAAIAAIDILENEPERLTQLRENTAYFREQMGRLGFRIPPGITPIVPVIVGETSIAIKMQKLLLEKHDIFVSGFGYPVVPEGEARLRCQISSAHTREDLDRAVAAFRVLREDESIWQSSPTATMHIGAGV